MVYNNILCLERLLFGDKIGRELPKQRLGGESKRARMMIISRWTDRAAAKGRPAWRAVGDGGEYEHVDDELA